MWRTVLFYQILASRCYSSQSVIKEHTALQPSNMYQKPALKWYYLVGVNSLVKGHSSQHYWGYLWLAAGHCEACPAFIPTVLYFTAPSPHTFLLSGREDKCRNLFWLLADLEIAEEMSLMNVRKKWTFLRKITLHYFLWFSVQYI